jgi:hypothetical protein
LEHNKEPWGTLWEQFENSKIRKFPFYSFPFSGRQKISEILDEMFVM